MEEESGSNCYKNSLRRVKTSGCTPLLPESRGDNQVSRSLFEAADFEDIGARREVGRKFGKLLDAYLMQKIYSE